MEYVLFASLAVNVGLVIALVAAYNLNENALAAVRNARAAMDATNHLLAEAIKLRNEALQFVAESRRRA